jgi:flagellar hook-basal body complex protein FliE
MTKIGIESSQLSSIRTTLLDNAKLLSGKTDADNGFGEKMKGAIESVADAQKDSKILAENFELGKEQDLTKVMVGQNVSSLAFQMTLNVRNKVLSAYKDIMNMPV